MQAISVASKKAPRKAAICGNILLEIRRVRISGATLLETRQNVLSANRLKVNEYGLFLLGVQLMRGFLRDKELRIMDFPDEHNEFKSLLLGTQRGTVGEMLCTGELFDRSNLVSGDPSTEEVTLSDKHIEMIVPLPPIKRIALDEDDMSELIEMYKTLLPDCEVVSAQRLCDSFS